ncbi:hypothetical protein ACF0H5_001577 [Mactra antiquata]
MVYVTVQEDTENRLYLTRKPTLNSWAILVGCSSVGLGIVYYGNDPLWMKAIYLVLGCMMGLSSMDDWEECDFNKEEGVLRLKRYSIWDVIMCQKEHVVVAQIPEIVSTSIEVEKGSYFGDTYQIVLKLSTGFFIGLTQSFTYGPSTEHEQIAEKIHKFLNLDDLDLGNDYVDTSSDSEDGATDDFEHVDPAEIIQEMETDVTETSEEKCDNVKSELPPEDE